jgi:hypothetical protein
MFSTDAFPPNSFSPPLVVEPANKEDRILKKIDLNEECKVFLV